MQYRVSWKKRFRCPGKSWKSPGIFSNQESGNPVPMRCGTVRVIVVWLKPVLHCISIVADVNKVLIDYLACTQLCKFMLGMTGISTAYSGTSSHF